MRMGTEFVLLHVFLQSKPDLAADEETAPNLDDYRRDLGIGLWQGACACPDVDTEALKAVLR